MGALMVNFFALRGSTVSMRSSRQSVGTSIRGPRSRSVSRPVAPEWSVANVQSAVNTVKPRAAKCLEGWSGTATNDDGQVVVEVVLSPEGLGGRGRPSRSGRGDVFAAVGRMPRCALGSVMAAAVEAVAAFHRRWIKKTSRGADRSGPNCGSLAAREVLPGASRGSVIPGLGRSSP